MDALPGPRLLAYLALFVLVAAVDQVGHWAGGVPVGTIEPLRLVEGSFPVIILLGIAASNDIAQRALDQLRPALTVSDADVDYLRSDLTRTPARWAVAAAVLGFTQAIVSIASTPAAYGLAPGSPPLLWAIAVAIGGASVGLAFAFMAHAIHQLRVVTRVHGELATIDVFRLDPLYAFAGLTSFTGIAMLGFGVYGVVSLSVVGEIGLSFIDLVTTAVLVVLAVALFVVPLLGLHGRIVVEKSRQRGLAGESLAAAIAELHRRMAAGEFENSKEVSDALVAATSAYATISKIPAWPWRQETLRGFLGAAALPIVIWTVTAVLSRVI